MKIANGELRMSGGEVACNPAIFNAGAPWAQAGRLLPCCGSVFMVPVLKINGLGRSSEGFKLHIVTKFVELFE